jgi:hypothetical protein
MRLRTPLSAGRATSRVAAPAALVAALVLAAPPSSSLAPPAAQAAKSTAKKQPKRTVEGELTRLRRAGSITLADRRAWRATYRQARAAVRSLPKRSTAARELQGVLDNTEDMARRGRISASLAPSVFLTLQVNRDWWTSRPIPVAGSRPTVPGSPLVWQYYVGEGLQIQWLGTFGLANALGTTTNPEKLAQQQAIGDEALRLASSRAGGPSWQYLFDFGGGAPPWGSGMAQITGMQALTRLAGRTGQAGYRTTALRAVSLVRRAPTSGARYKRPAGDHILLYTFTRMRVLNAFAQSVSGLREVALSTGDAKVGAAYVRAERELRAELPAYDTGRWTRYSLGGANATVSYHVLSRDLVRGLCKALEADAVAFAAGQPVPAGVAPPPAAPYCAAAERYTAYLQRTPNGPGAKARSRAAGGATSTPPPREEPTAGLADGLLQPGPGESPADR